MTKNSKRLTSIISVLVAAIMVLALVVGCTPTANGTISLDKTELSMYVGDSATLTATAPEDAEITWTSSNDQVVSVRRGRLSALAEGKATITATLENNASATCEVTVLTRTVTIDKTEATIDLDTDAWTVQLNATSSDGGEVSWSSSDTTLATVDKGLVTATGKNIGTVTITAQRGAASAECVITIVQPSRPVDWKLLEKRTNAETIAAAGTWVYFADGNSNDINFTQDPYSGGGELGVTFDLGPNPGNGKFYYFRYQPTFGAADPMTEEGQLYLATMIWSPLSEPLNQPRKV